MTRLHSAADLRSISLTFQVLWETTNRHSIHYCQLQQNNCYSGVTERSSSGLDQIDGGYEVVWGVNRHNEVWHRHSVRTVITLGDWETSCISQNTSKISVSNNEMYIWGISTTNETFMCQSCSCMPVDTQIRLVDIEVGDKEVWGVNATNHIFKRPVDGSGEWRSVPGEMRYISASGYRYVWGIAPNDSLYNCEMPCDDGEWRYIGDNFKLVEASRNNVFGVQTNNTILSFSAINGRNQISKLLACKTKCIQ